jgi:spore germination cell wall hydrolase CwlJ-like protein
LTERFLAKFRRACIHAAAIGSAALALAITFSPAKAGDLVFELVPASYSPTIAVIRMQPALVEPTLTPQLLSAYIQRKQQLTKFDHFNVAATGRLTDGVLSSYIARQRNPALDAIESVDTSPALTADLLTKYVEDDFRPTSQKVELANEEMLCLTQAIYHEARGETENGQMAVANVIVNRAMSRKFPSTICGVVFQNADQGKFRCQFTFACDGRSDMGTERRAWNRASHLAEVAFREFQHGKRPEIVPNSTLYYHTTAVRPNWSNTFNRVAAIGSHVFYAVN